MREQVNNDEIRTNIGGGAFWNSNGNSLPADCAEILGHTDVPFSLVETAGAREAQIEILKEHGGNLPLALNALTQHAQRLVSSTSSCGRSTVSRSDSTGIVLQDLSPKRPNCQLGRFFALNRY